MSADSAARAWRLFLALWPDAPLRAQLAAESNRWRWPPGARRTPDERLHATLHFLGDVPLESVEALAAGLGRIAVRAFQLRLDRPQVWPGGIAVLEASGVPQELASLHDRLGDVLRSSGLATDARRYRPHVTFARKAQGARPPAAAPPCDWDCSGGFVLVRSLPGGQGYQLLQRFG